MNYLNAALPALQIWSAATTTCARSPATTSLDYLDTLAHTPRMGALSALRSLFAWAARERVIFRNPARRIPGAARAHPVRQRLTDDDIARAVSAARTPQARVFVTLAAVHAARPGQIRALQLIDVDLGNRRLTIAGTTRPLDDLTHRVLRDWLRHRAGRWPCTANPHLLISKESALRHGPVSATFILDLRGLATSLERLRIDRQLEEALAQAGDPLALTAMFGIAESTAITYAINARRLLDNDHGATPSGSLPTPASDPDNRGDRHSGSG